MCQSESSIIESSLCRVKENKTDRILKLVLCLDSWMKDFKFWEFVGKKDYCCTSDGVKHKLSAKWDSLSLTWLLGYASQAFLRYRSTFWSEGITQGCISFIARNYHCRRQYKNKASRCKVVMPNIDGVCDYCFQTHNASWVEHHSITALSCGPQDTPDMVSSLALTFFCHSSNGIIRFQPHSAVLRVQLLTKRHMRWKKAVEDRTRYLSRAGATGEHIVYRIFSARE